LAIELWSKLGRLALPRARGRDPNLRRFVVDRSRLSRAPALSWPDITVKPQIMKKVKPKKRGRPATGKAPFIGVRLPPAMINHIDGWSKRHKAATRSAAIRALIELGFKNER
jgi:hypothetical protein